MKYAVVKKIQRDMWTEVCVCDSQSCRFLLSFQCVYLCIRACCTYRTRQDVRKVTKRSIFPPVHTCGSVTPHLKDTTTQTPHRPASLSPYLLSPPTMNYYYYYNDGNYPKNKIDTDRYHTRVHLLPLPLLPRGWYRPLRAHT